MSILSRHSKNKKQRSPKTSHTTERPKLYVLATKPVISTNPLTTEWSLDLRFPSVSDKPLTSTSTESGHKHGVLSGTIHKRKDEPAAETRLDPDTAVAAVTKPERHCYFSRLHPISHVEEPPKDVVLKVFLTSFPITISTSSASSQSETLVAAITDALQPVHLTSDSASWLRQALFALQVPEIIPPISHGLDVNKFMGFAAIYLEQHLRDLTGKANEGTDGQVKMVNYSKILQENDRLRRLFDSQETTDYAVINSSLSKEQVGGDEVGEEEDVWNIPLRGSSGKPVKGEKAWGGFWLTHGSGAIQSRNESRPGEQKAAWERKDVYGGLM